jgi:hypothetical protein
MTTTIGNNGRLGNQIIRNLAVSFIAEKHNLYVNYYNSNLISELGITFYSGNNIYNDFKELTDHNYFDVYNESNLNYNLDPNNNFFQSKEITNKIYNYLHSDIIKSTIIKKNIFKERYNNNNDLFIHIRLGDVAHFNPGIDYYLNAIKKINNYNLLYISTDNQNHDIIKKIIEEYPNTYINNMDEIRTIQFGSTCKNIILSHGSFSAIIGYLAFYSNIYYPKYDENKKWYGDMFTINNWIEL